VEQGAPSRIRTLDLIRGIAVLGILTVNIASFAAPTGASYSPNLPQPGSMADAWAFAFNLLLFEGKMRALFSILFGASLLLFIERKDAQGQSGIRLQLRRLFWLALIGWLHFALLWDGDILFLYSAIGLAALLLRRQTAAELAIAAVLIFTFWQIWGVASWVPSVAQEAAVNSGTASAKEQASHARIITDKREADRADTRATLSPWRMEVAARQAEKPLYPVSVVAYTWGETLAYMLIGMALFKSGFYAGGWARKRLWQMAVGGTGLGLALTLGFMLWAHPRGYPELAMHLAIGFGLSFPHLLTALGYAALLVLTAPALLQTRLGQRLEAAGTVAFSNYLGTTLVMCGLFSGWGLGLFGQYGAAVQWLFVVFGWLLMLSWSKPWLARYRQGPLEWLWRSLTAMRLEPLRR
jgi:uncharacterized protein